MNIAPLCVLIIITGGTDGFHVENARVSYKEETRERISSRKLQTLERNDPADAKTTTWNQILADVLVNRIKIFTFHKMAENEKATAVETSSSLLTNCISQMMHLYKVLVYDKIYKVPEYTKTLADRDTELEIDSSKRSQSNADKDANAESGIDLQGPKDEVELIEPRYHGKLCDDCEGKTEKYHTTENEFVETTEIVETAATGCPVGLVASEGGRCTDSKSKFILSIPYQCPIGYRRDWLGFCRPQL